MKSVFVFIIGLAFLATSASGQKSPAISRLATLGEVWGFLKYYHPAAASRVDWDSALLVMIPKVQQCTSQLQFDELLHGWFNALPAAKLNPGRSQPAGDSITRTFGEADIKRMNINKPLKSDLIKLFQYHVPDTSRYITEWYKEYHLDFILHTENPYDSITKPAADLRLLSLFRYWNSIRYFYPHVGRVANWNRILLNYIPVFIKADDVALYEQAVLQLVHELPDSHSFFQSATYSKRYQFTSPFTLMYAEGRYIIRDGNDKLMEEHDYRKGDVIEAINDVSISELETNLLKVTTGTNKLSVHRNIARELLAGVDSVLSISFRRGQKSFTKTVELHSWSVHNQLPASPPAALWEEKLPGIWYVRFCKIRSADTLKHLFKTIENAKAVIWEMRDYPDFNVTTFLKDGLFDNKILASTETNAVAAFPGTFVQRHGYVMAEANSAMPKYKGQMIVLVDERTQSLSESVSALLRLRAKTIVMGRQTAGTTGNITNLELPGGIVVSYTGVGVTGSDRTFTQGNGVKLDVKVKLTVKNIQQNGDIILNEALKLAGTYQ